MRLCHGHITGGNVTSSRIPFLALSPAGGPAYILPQCLPHNRVPSTGSPRASSVTLLSWVCVYPFSWATIQLCLIQADCQTVRNWTTSAGREGLPSRALASAPAASVAVGTGTGAGVARLQGQSRPGAPTGASMRRQRPTECLQVHVCALLLLKMPHVLSMREENQNTQGQSF